MNLPGVGEAGQKKLQAAKIAVVGAGGLGSPVLQLLAAAGIGNICVIDGDFVDLSNLHRQTLYNENDIGKRKAVVASEKIRAIHSALTIKSVAEYLTADNAMELLNDCDLICDSSDNFETRYLINDVCVKLNKPFVSAAILQFEGQLGVFNWDDSPTYRCLFPQPPADAPDCNRAGVLGSLPSVFGSLQANEILKMILGLDGVLSGKLFVQNLLSYESSIFSFSRNELIIQKIKQEPLPDADAYRRLCESENRTESELTAEQFLQWKISGREFQLIDVRDEWEYAESNLGGINIPLAEFESRINEIRNDIPVLIHCISGFRSSAAIEMLMDKSWKGNLYNLRGGIAAVQKLETNN